MNSKQKHSFSIIQLARLTGAIITGLTILITVFFTLLSKEKDNLNSLDTDYYTSKQIFYDLSNFSDNLSKVNLHYFATKNPKLLNYFYDFEKSYLYNAPFFWSDYYVNYFLLENKLPYTKEHAPKLKQNIEKLRLSPELKSQFYELYYLLRTQINEENSLLIKASTSQMIALNNKTISKTVDSIEIDSIQLLDTFIVNTLHHTYTTITKANNDVKIDISNLDFFKPKFLSIKFKFFDKLFLLEKRVNNYYHSNRKTYLAKINIYRTIFYLTLTLLVLFVLLFLIWGIKHLKLGLSVSINYLNALSKGEIIKTTFNSKFSEVIQIKESINKIENQRTELQNIAETISKGDLNYDYKGIYDKIGTAFLSMRNSLKLLVTESEEREEREKKENWINESLAKFNEVLRKSDAEESSDFHMGVLKEILKSINANQGGLFVLKNDEDGDYLELKASFAYNIERKIQKKIRAGIGVLGNIIYEKNTIYLDKIPNDYLEITSGIGQTTPKYLFIQPLLLGGNIEGAIEIATFNPIEEHHQTYLHRVGENLASVLSTIHNQENMKKLLNQSKIQHDTLATQEEELRQNLEELSATQEEIIRKEHEMKKLENAINEGLLRVEMDIKGRVIYANPSFLQAFNISFLDASGSDFASFLNRTMEELFSIKWKNLIRKNTGFSLEGNFISHGQSHYIVGNLQPLQNENKTIYKIIFMGLIAENIPK